MYLSIVWPIIWLQKCRKKESKPLEILLKSILYTVKMMKNAFVLVCMKVLSRGL